MYPKGISSAVSPAATCFGARALRFAWLGLVFLCSCDVALPQGAFRCSKDADCPDGWSCRDRLCYFGNDSISGAETPDAGESDASAGRSSLDASTEDGAAPDASDDSSDADIVPPDGDAAVSGETDASLNPAADGGGGTHEPPAPSEPAVDQPCSPNGAKACRGHASFDKLVCQSGRWIIIGVCDGTYRCNSKPGASLGSCQPIPPLCLDKNPGDPVCDGLERKRCDADLLHYDPYACPEHAHCESDGTSNVRCACDSGYTDDGAGGCKNIDDCPNNTCAPGTCVDGLNAYTCDCPSGYTSAGTTCANVNDCPSPDPCSPGSCVDGVNAFSCSCPSGFTSTGASCSNVNDCPAADPCGPGYCVDQVNTFTCACPTGHANTGTTCVNVNDCPSPDPCAPGACVDGINDYSCSCPSGYAPAGHVCQNIDDCPGNQCEPGGSCVDLVNDYTCDCQPPCWYNAGRQCYFDSSCVGGF
jgi:Human growth factor-like EGF